MSEGQATSRKITSLGKAVKTKNMTRHKQRIDDQSKNQNYPQVHAVIAVDNIGQQIVLTRTKLVTSVVKWATKQHAVRTKEIKRVRQARSNINRKNWWKYETVHILDKKVDLQLDSGSDLSIINLNTWKKLKKTMMRKTNKTARAVTGDKMKFKGELTLPITLNGTTKKVKVFVHKQFKNLFGMDWMECFKLWGQSINNFCHQRENSTTKAQKFKVELRENALPVRKKKRKYHSRSNGQMERFVDTLKRTRKKALNPITPSTGSPAKIRFTRKIRSAFDKLIPKQSKINTTEHVTRKRFLSGQKIFFKSF